MPPYKCPFCSFTNINKSNLKTHLNKKKLCYNKNELSNFIINNHKLINKLQKKDNFYYSNHIAGLTKESVEKTDLFIYKNFLKKIKLYK